MANDTWATPPHVFEPLHAEFGFALDVCALPETAKCHRFYSPEDDGLTQSWAPDICWCNPPYSKPEPWVRRAYAESEKGATVVMLLPVDPSTRWWAVFWDHKNHRMRREADEVRYLSRRIRFVGGANSSTRPCAVVVLRPPFKVEKVA